jgi:hypothetical protein
MPHMAWHLPYAVALAKKAAELGMPRGPMTIGRNTKGTCRTCLYAVVVASVLL